MCGIAGFSLSPQTQTSNSSLFWSDALNRSIEILEHRGPDDSGIFFNEENSIGLAHKRLAIIETSSAGHQPFISDDKKFVLVFNGEIYNYKELQKQLIEEGFEFATNSDTEVIISLYRYHKRRNHNVSTFLKRLNGIFAFALWDRTEEKIVIARDAFGIKPLYYHKTADSFSFASEIKALLTLMPKSDVSIDVASINRYLTFLWCPGVGTPIQNVKKFGPGEVVVVEKGVVVIQEQWYTLPVFKKRTNKKISSSYAILETQRLLRRAVHKQLVADVPVGAFLSGGLDSSSIVALAKEKIPYLNCFTIDSNAGKKEGFVDDLPFARKVASYLDVPLEIVKVDPDQMMQSIEQMVWSLDEPLADPAAISVKFISHLAKSSGIKVLLSGAGGDDIFTGYRRHRALMIDGLWSWFPKSTRKHFDFLSSKINKKNATGRRLAKLFTTIGLEENERIANYFRWVSRIDLLQLYTKDIRNIIENERAEQPILDFLSLVPTGQHKLEKMLSVDQRFFLTDHNLIYTDKMSMSNGVEVRVPFLENELVEFAGSLPSNLKQKGATGKWVLKKAMESVLPNDIIYRPKTGFGLPLRGWINGGLKELVLEILSEDSLKARGLFNPKAVHLLINANLQGKVDASYTIFSLLCIEIWFRKFLK